MIDVLKLCLALLIAQSACAQVVINEIFYHAPDDNPELEWIELYNAGDTPVQIGGWRLVDGVEFTFPVETIMAADSYLIVCQNKDLFSEYYDVEVLGEFSGKLSNRGELISLQDAAAKNVDQVTYADSGRWPLAPDGYSASLEKIVPHADGGRPSSWAASTMSATDRTPAGTPGAINSCHSDVVRPAVSVTAARFTAGKPIPVVVHLDPPMHAVDLLYQVAKPGEVGPERAVPMKLVEGDYQADIPAHPASTLVRYRIRCRHENDSVTIHPHPHALRPAYSAYVLGHLPQRRIPLAFVVNTHPATRIAMANRLKSTQHVGNDRREIMRQFRQSQQIEARLNPASGWFAVSVMDDLNRDTFNSAKAALAQFENHKKTLFVDVEGGDNFDVKKTNEVFSKLSASLKGKLSEDQIRQLQSNVSHRGGRSAAATVHNTLPLEDDWFELIVHFQPSYDEYVRMRSIFRKAFERRAKILANLKSSISRRTTTELQAIQTELSENLGFRKRRHLLDVAQNQGSFFRPNFAGLTSEPAVGHSAFVIVEPESDQAEVFDFVNVSTRSAGFKVRLHKDRPYREMRTVNIIFEYDDRFLLAEQLAFDLYDRAGVPACLTEFVRLEMDDQHAGYHLLFEHINGSFLRRNGRDSGGDLYKILWYGRSLEGQHQRKGAPEGGHAELSKLVNLLNRTSGDEQWGAIQEHFDVAEVAKYFAVNMVLSHWDGFFNNYFTHRDPGTQKWQMYAWDQDKTWGYYDGIRRNQDFVHMPLTFGMKGDRPTGGFFRRDNWWRPGGHFSSPLLANEKFRKVFLQETKRILDDIYSEQAYFPVIDELAKRIRPEIPVRANIIGESPEIAMERFDENLESLKRHLTKRRAFLLKQEELSEL